MSNAITVPTDSVISHTNNATSMYVQIVVNQSFICSYCGEVDD